MRIVLLALIGCSPSESKKVDPEPTEIPVTDTDTTLPTELPTAATWTDGTWTTTVDATGTDVRSYALSTDHPLRNDAAQDRVVDEVDGEAVLRSGSVLHDALFALAMSEMRANAVSEIVDGSFNNGLPTPCECFETGQEWTYVWTRDTAYAAHLALGWFAPQRAAESLRYKLSRPKIGTGLHIVQDTGSGGSWPVSSDRVTWALGATATLPHLVGAEHDAFRAEAAEAISNTAWQDHDVLLDSDGLMRGEQSFLDWREQTYPAHTASDVTLLAESKALGTNLAHLHLLRTGALLGDAELGNWAADLEDSLPAFWQDGHWSSWTGGALDPGPRAQRDLLATALAILLLDRSESGAEALAAYPRGPVGASVIWPNQPNVPIYHNRGQWPFVTAYDLWAARAVRNAEVFQSSADTLVRGAVLNLSNMENFEWFSGEPWVEAGDLSGPVVNSERQLWSVAGYLALWLRGVLGLEISADGSMLVVDPFLPSKLRGELGDELVMRDLPWQGRTLDVIVELPASEGDSWVLDTVSSEGVGYPDGEIPVGDVGSELRITLKAHTASAPAMARANEDLFAPAAPPSPTLQWNGIAVDVQLSGTVNVFRDGELVAEGVSGSWTDPESSLTRTTCYALTAVEDGRSSHRSQPACFWGGESERVQVLGAYGFSGDGAWSTEHGRAHVGSWGDPGHTLEQRFVAHTDGLHRLQVVYSNGAGGLTTGITASHKLARISTLDGSVVAEGTVVMAQTGAWDAWSESTTMEAELERNTPYRLELLDAPGLPNMSWLDHFTPYTGGLGGGTDAYGAANVSEIKLLAMEGTTELPYDSVGLDGVDDIAKLPFPIEPGATLQPWEGFALDWDDDYLYATWVGEAFEDPYAPAMLYLEVDATNDPSPGDGISYSNLTPLLPFTPTHAIAMRALADAGDGAGPWSGVWERQGTEWVQIRRLQDGVDTFVAADQHTLSARIPRYLLGDSLRVAGHVVRGIVGNEWVDTVPASHAPWDGSGAFYTVDLDGSHDPSDW